MALSSITLTQAHSAQLVIIIDDIGNNYVQGNAIVELEGPLTLAFLPHTPYAKRLANKAYLREKEIILHAPMENTIKAALGPGALTQALTETELKQTLKKAIASIPHAQGINNHMGSALTQNKQAMTWVMETLQEEQLYFIDSLTSPNSIAYQQAIKHQLPALRRHIFLDNDKSLEALTRQWNKALRIANKTGRAILIGHPYAESHAFLAKQLPKLAAQSIELIPASQLLLQQAWQEFEQSEQQANNSPNRYLLHNKNSRAIDNNEQNLISNNSRTQTH
jgi:polysaccharide deacetylase 2 family uncharacterized protein YibQ